MNFKLLTLIMVFIPLPTIVDAQQLQFSSYAGGSDFEQIRDITTDAYGNIYITGGTLSADFPVTLLHRFKSLR